MESHREGQVMSSQIAAHGTCLWITPPVKVKWSRCCSIDTHEISSNARDHTDANLSRGVYNISGNNGTRLSDVVHLMGLTAGTMVSLSHAAF